MRLPRLSPYTVDVLWIVAFGAGVLWLASLLDPASKMMEALR